MTHDRSRRRRLAGLGLVAVPAAFLVVFYAWPLANVLWRGLAPEGHLDLGAATDVLSSSSTARVLWFTFWQAAISTLLTLAIALPAAQVVARFRFPGRRALRALSTVAFVLPTVVVAAAFRTALRPLGVEQSLWAILAAHVFFNYAVVLRTVGGLWAHIDPRLEDAARVLGASRLQALREVTLPLLRPAIVAAAAITFIFTFTSFGVILLLGGPGHATLEVEIWRQTTYFLDLPTAAVLALLQLGCVVALLALYGRAQRRVTAQRLAPVAATARPPRGAAERSWVILQVAIATILLVVPMAILVEQSLATPSGYGLDFYRSLSENPRGSVLFVSAAEAVRNSLVFAAAATAMAVGLGVLAATAISRTGGRREADARGQGRGRRIFDASLMLPLGTSAVTLGFGFLLALDSPPLDLRTSPLLVPIAQALIATPFVVRAVAPVMRSIDPHLRDAASVLGASPWRVWRHVDLPMVFRALLVGIAFAFCISLGEFGATVLLARPDTPTMPVAVFRLLSKPGAANYGQAMAMSTILMATTALAVLAIERVRVRDLGDF